jgi:hypothetical protein
MGFSSGRTAAHPVVVHAVTMPVQLAAVKAPIISARGFLAAATKTKADTVISLKPTVAPVGPVNKATVVPTAPTPETAKEGPCLDKDVGCGEWAQLGECDNNAAYMQAACPCSCREYTTSTAPATSNKKEACKDHSKDQDPSCGAWAEEGECKANAEFMAKECMASCGVCQ